MHGDASTDGAASSGLARSRDELLSAGPGTLGLGGTAGGHSGDDAHDQGDDASVGEHSGATPSDEYVNSATASSGSPLRASSSASLSSSTWSGSASRSTLGSGSGSGSSSHSAHRTSPQLSAASRLRAPSPRDSDDTPRAEHPPPLVQRATVVPDGTRGAGEASATAPGPTRESTIKGRDQARRSHLNTTTTGGAEGGASGPASTDESDTLGRRRADTRDTRRDSYFPDVDAHFGAAGSASPSAPTASSPRIKPDLRRRRSSDNEPWPSSARHGPTPPGMGMGMGGLMRSLSPYLGEAVSPLSIDEAGKASPGPLAGAGAGPSSREHGWAERALEQYAATADATGLRIGADDVLTGWEVSTALSPPPGYPMLPSRAVGSQASSAAGSGPGSAESSPRISPSADSEHRGSVASTSSGWSQAPSVGIVGSYSSSGAAPLPGTPMQGHVAPRVMPRNPATDHDTYEGTITIDTNPARYVISAKLDGFRLDDITIAVKSVSPASSSASRSSVSSRMSDSVSGALGVFDTSGNGSQPTFEPRVRSTSRSSMVEGDHAVPPSWMAEMASSSAGRPKHKGGKVLHLLADRWDDNGGCQGAERLSATAEHSNDCPTQPTLSAASPSVSMPTFLAASRPNLTDLICG